MDDMKKCPQCGEMVKAIAKKCRYCGHWFEEEAPSAQPVEEKKPVTAQPAAEPKQTYSQPSSDNGSKISIESILIEGITWGLSKFITIFGATILWLLTIWIPYLNVGTTIAIKTMPIALADNDDPSGPTYIFDGKYRKYMGEYFTLIGLKGLSLIPAYLFLIVPGIIISLGWSMALYLVFDKHISPGEALLLSNEKTFGHKMTLFLAGVLFNLAFIILFALIWWLLGLIDVAFITIIIMLLLIAVYMVGNVGCQAVIYRKLCK